MSTHDRVPSPSIAPPRWPGLVASVGGEAAIRQFMSANPSDGGGNRWERGFSFLPNDCDSNRCLPLTTCDGGFANGECDDAADLPDVVDTVPLYYSEFSQCSTFTNDPDDLTRRATAKLERSTSFNLEYEFWTGTAHTMWGLDGQSLAGDSATLWGGSDVPLVCALAELQAQWAECSMGRRAMIHATPRTASLWYANNAIRRENGLLLDAFDNIVVAGTGYDGSDPRGTVDESATTAFAYISPVVSIRLSGIEVVQGLRTDIGNNVDRATAYRAGIVYCDPCCIYGISVDHGCDIQQPG